MTKAGTDIENILLPLRCLTPSQIVTRCSIVSQRDDAAIRLA
ncbi:MAG: hypothetical protein ABI656_11705 [bacterium]